MFSFVRVIKIAFGKGRKPVGPVCDDSLTRMRMSKLDGWVVGLLGCWDVWLFGCTDPGWLGDDADDGLHLLGNALPLTLTATLSTHLTYNLITHTHFINSFSTQPSAPLAHSILFPYHFVPIAI